MVPRLPPPPPLERLDESPPVVHPEYILVDLDGDFLVSGSDEETDLLPHAQQWASDVDFLPGSLVIYKRHAILEI